MKIVLCDDHKVIFDEMEKLLHKFDEQNQIQSECIYFERPSQVYQYMQENSVDLLFMDLEFYDEAEDGILWLKKIKKQFSRTIVIIITAYEKRYKEGYETRAFRFMTKPIEEKELFDYLKVSMEELELTNSISLMRRGIPHNILIRDICYFRHSPAAVNYGPEKICISVKKACCNGNRRCRWRYFSGVTANIL